MVQLVATPDPGVEAVRLVGELQSQLPDWRADLSSPLRYALEQRAREKFAELSLLNVTGQQLIIGTATGPDLDDLLANFDMLRVPGESDAAFRARVPDAWAALSRETEPGLLRRLIEITPAGDASMMRGANYAVTLWVQDEDYDASDAALRTAVQTTMNSATERPWYSNFTVSAETRTAYTITGTVTLEMGFVQSQVEPAVNTALDAALLAQRRLNRVPQLSPMIVAVHDVDGVASVNLVATPGAALTATAAPGTVWVGTRGSLTYA